MLDDYNVLDQFNAIYNLSLFKTIFNKFPTRELKPSNKKFKQVIFVTNYQFLPFLFLNQILSEKGIETSLILADKNPESDKSSLVISNIDKKTSNEFVNYKSDDPHFIKFWEDVLKIAKLLDKHQLSQGLFLEIRQNLHDIIYNNNWHHDTNLIDNLAKQIPLHALGKSGLFITSNQFRSVGVAFSLNWQLSAKNVAFSETINNFNQQSAPGWTYQPIDKPFAIFDIVSKLDNKANREAFVIKNRLMSGKMPGAKIWFLHGENILEQTMYGILLAQYSGIYLAVLNKVRPDKKDLLQKLNKL